MAELSEVQKLYKDLRKFVRRDNYTKAVNVCTQLRKKLPDDLDPLRCHCVCLLKGDKFQQSFDVATKAANGAPGSDRDPASFLLLERAYCLYRLNKLSAALKLLAGAANKAKRPELLHLEAQIRYRQGDFDSAIDVYNQVLPHEDDPTEALSNLCAAHFAGGRGAEGLEAVPEDFSAASSSHELAYNLGCCAAQAGQLAHAEQRLSVAEERARKGLAEDGWEPEEVEQEVAVVLVQLAYVLQLAGDAARAARIYKSVTKSKPEDAAVAAAAANNLAALRGDRDLFNSIKLVERAAKADKLPDSSKQTVAFNKTTLLLYANKYDECRSAAQALGKKYPAAAGRGRVLEAACLLREGRTQEGEKLLRALPDDAEAQLTLAHVLLTRGERAEAAKTLLGIKALQHSPATVATVTAIYDAAGDGEAAMKVFEEATRKGGGDDEGAAQMQGAAARFMLEHGNHADAARAYEAIVEGGSVGGAERLRATASLVLALASSGKGSDSEKAERWATRLPDVSASGAGAGGDGEGQELDADALEKGATLRALSRRLAQPVKAAKHAMEEKKKLPNPNRVAKKRAKRREAHVAKLQERLKDAPQGEKMKDPDPERWIPRRERASFLRKQRRGKFGSAAQGTGHAGEKDAIKLDARLRKEMEEANPSAKKVKGVLNTGKSTMARRSGKKKKKR